ncbi:hypothetical protein EF808_00400 [archaeon]|nr:MAG: hypothetical protein EF808_00400 [archaeon]
MEIRDAQRKIEAFCKERTWDEFRPSLVYVHLMEEISEIGEEILFEEGYKKEGAGHERSNPDVSREFAQTFSLLLQLASHFDVDLDDALARELDVMRERFPPERWQ